MDVRAEMAANVWQVVHGEGAAVTAGDTILVLESMKMEIPVLAEANGRLHLAVVEGQAVQEGDLLAHID